MFDIHSHVIYGVDDGPKTLEESIALLEDAYQQGVRVVVATSHRRKGMFETPETTILEHFRHVKQALADRLPDLQLLYGAELYFTSDILDKLEQKQVPTLNDTRFALVEFSGRTPWKDIHKGLQKLLFQGITPVVAHIERYDALAFEKDRVAELIKMGCYTQINSLSATKPKLFGDGAKLHKKRAAYFLEEGLVHVVSSDMHNLTNRQSYMKDAYQQILKRYGQAKADDLFIHNAKTLLNNEYI
ncbi:capsular polysaccharide biosynthesis protein Cps4B [Streptococcus ovuberis]|uniref:Tyrosine-protein phosphatase n=1 Tax=Streptococcus ovuberis TaxID=1936207 RepID=A0A7X6MXW4_9STRE|nr:capsular polysaccharide biosynthesis protein Cps4B [Streptococcus ovuberis]NKZ19391.1 tyrosine protein phosphatase [Streptococcus ovuberis]